MRFSINATIKAFFAFSISSVFACSGQQDPHVSSHSDSGNEVENLTLNPVFSTKQTTISYTGATGKSYTSAVVAPTAAGSYPLFIWIPGTIDKYNTATAMRIITTMAERGVVAVSVGYNNAVLDPAGCAAFDDKAKAIFDRTRANSLLSNLLKQYPAIDIKKGVVVGGHSQGSYLSARAPRFVPETKAAWMLGTGYLALNKLSTCAKQSESKLQNVRAINGESDTVYGNTAVNRDQVQKISGRCVGCASNSFFDSDASGYYLVTATELKTKAEHNYYQTSNLTPNTVWDSTDAAWGRKANQAWLLKTLGINK